MYKIIGCLFIILQASVSFSQQNIRQNDSEELYRLGLKLHQEKAFRASSEIFTQYMALPNSKSYALEANFYLAMNELQTDNKKGIASLKSFSDQNRAHPLVSVANYFLGNDAFERKKYSEALSYYSNVAEDQLDKWELLTFLFKKGYTHMIVGEDEKAIANFTQVTFYQDNYYQEATYYLGLIHTNAENYDKALTTLSDGVDEKGEYASLIAELLANIYYQIEDYDKLISFSKERLTSSASQLNRTLHRLLGETYFLKQEYQLAAAHFQRHQDFSKRKMDADGYYKLGYSYYKNGNDKGAIDNFKIAALENGSLGQSSSFYLGKLYLKSENYSYALSAFRSAITQGDDEKMREEASFLTGKIDYSSGQYGDAINSLKQFQSDYPQSRWSNEASELLAKSYLKTSDYDQAINYIEELSVKTSSIKEAYQSVCFMKAQQLFNDSRFEEAIDFFEKSLLFPVDKKIASEGYYLLGEAHSIEGNEAEARNAFLSCKRLGNGTEWANLSLYGLGYLSYNSKQYEEAESYFKSFGDKVPATHQYYADSRTRLADCQFVQKKYDDAINSYSSLLSNEGASQDYINYQLGITYSLMDERDKARQSFSNVITFSGKSSYKDNALFQTGESFIADALFIKAAESFTQLIHNYPESSLIPFSYSRRASCYFNLNQNDGAKEDYGFILSNYMSHSVAKGSLLGLQELIKRGTTVDSFEQYLEDFRQANPDDSSLEVIAFEGAKNRYYNQNYEEAVAELKAFKLKYPESSFALDVNYFIADAYYQLEEWEEASNNFLKLTSGENNAYRTRSLDKRGKSLLEINEFSLAQSNYHQLLQYSNNKKEQFIGREGLMKSHFLSNRMDSAIYYANKIFDDTWQPVGVEESLWLLKGKALFNIEEYSRAADELIKVLNGPMDENSAEAKYYIANVFYKQGLFKQSLEALFDLNRNYGSYDYWIGKSFILIADNYVGLDELLQAKETLKSVIENSPEKSIVDTAKEKLMLIEIAEKELLVQDTLETDSIKVEK